MSFELSQQRVVVTGAARGIGASIAACLNGLGASVVGWDRDTDAVENPEVFQHLCTVDVTREDSLAGAWEQTLEQLGGIDILVANAGVNGPTKPAWEYTLREWEHVISVDLTGVFLSTRQVIPHMRANGYGRLIVISSIAGKEGNAGACAYGAAKSGVIGYVKGLARELVDDGITVNAVAPVITETSLMAEMSDTYIAQKRSLIPMNRFCTPQEIADMTAWIASPRCSFTTGQVFDVSGGRATY